MEGQGESEEQGGGLVGPGQVARKPAAVQPGHGNGVGCAPALLLPVLDPRRVRISLPLGRGEGPSETCAKSEANISLYNK